MTSLFTHTTFCYDKKSLYLGKTVVGLETPFAVPAQERKVVVRLFAVL